MPSPLFSCPAMIASMISQCMGCPQMPANMPPLPLTTPYQSAMPGLAISEPYGSLPCALPPSPSLHQGCLPPMDNPGLSAFGQPPLQGMMPGHSSGKSLLDTPPSIGVYGLPGLLPETPIGLGNQEIPIGNNMIDMVPPLGMISPPTRAPQPGLDMPFPLPSQGLSTQGQVVPDVNIMMNINLPPEVLHRAQSSTTQQQKPNQQKVSAQKQNRTQDRVTVQQNRGIKNVSMRAGNFFFNPREITVKRGQPVKITLAVENPPHSFRIDELGVNKDINHATETIEFTPNRTGTFTYYCDKPGHRQRGMEGKIHVTE